MMLRTRTRTAALLAVPVLAVAGCGTEGGSGASDTPGQSPTDTASSAPAPSSPTESASTETTSPITTMAMPLYWVGETPRGPRLYREFRQVDDSKPLEATLSALVEGMPDDPDYRSLLPSTAPITIVNADDQLVVGVDAQWATRPAGMSKAEAKLAVQQVVYTVQGVAQRREPVTFEIEGGGSDVLGLGKATFQAAPHDTVLALVNITQPEEGATLERTFLASGVANSFEATVPWEIRDASGATVLDGFATAEGWMDRLYPWESEVDASTLAPGTYTFVAMTDDPSDGEGPGPFEDTKTFTVE